MLDKGDPAVVMLDKGDPVEIAEHYRRIMDGTLVGDDELIPKRRRRCEIAASLSKAW